MNVRLFAEWPGFFYNTDEKSFFSTQFPWNNVMKIETDSMIRYLKTRYTNKERFQSNFIKPISELVTQWEMMPVLGIVEMLQKLDALYDMATPFSYSEAFRIDNEQFKSLVFGSIRVPEMIKEMGHTRIVAAGRPVKHKQFSKTGEFLGYREYDVIFETHRVSGAKLGLRRDVYAVRCWCTTTDNEHWLWIDGKYKNDPFEAIARTFFIHENLIPFIKELKRQGDILLVELTQEVEPRGELVSLSKEMYFDLLTAQS